MRIDLSDGVPTNEIPREFHRFLSWTGESAWRDKIEKFAKLSRLSDQNVYANYLAAKNPFTSAFKEFFALERSGRKVAKHAGDTLLKAAGHIIVANRVFHEGTDRLRNELKGAILDDDTVKSVLFELDIATHFFRCGYDVGFIDFAGEANYDLMISDGTTFIEVECKRKSVDAGRKIARREFYLLSDILASQLCRMPKRIVIDIDCDGRLGSNQELFRRVAEKILESSKANLTAGELDHIRFDISYLPSDLVIRTHEEGAKVLAPYWSGSAHFAIFSGPDSTVVIKCESTKTDRVLRAIYEELKDGATQFTKTRPALLACFIEDLDDTAWSDLADRSGLQNMTHRLLSGEERSHLWRVVYSSDRTPVKRVDNIVEFAATTLSWKNPACKFVVPNTFLRPGKNESPS